jgi:hypothetical protein
MAQRGGQPGNTNGRRGTDWRDAIRYALSEVGREYRDGETDEPAYKIGLREIAKEFVMAAKSGEAWAMKELGDRVDGKATQAVEVSGPDGEPVQTALNYVPVCPSDK